MKFMIPSSYELNNHRVDLAMRSKLNINSRKTGASENHLRLLQANEIARSRQLHKSWIA